MHMAQDLESSNSVPLKRYYLPDATFSICVYSGVLDEPTLISGATAHCNDPLYNDSAIAIAELAAVERFDLDFESMQRVVERHTTLFPSDKAMAIHAPSQLSYGIGRMYQSLCRNYGTMIANVFSDESDLLDSVGLKDKTLSRLKTRCIARPI